MISAEQADYLEDSNIAFGIEVNDDIRAYPIRLPANRAFWFGWFSSYSHTQLVY